MVAEFGTKLPEQGDKDNILPFRRRKSLLKLKLWPSGDFSIGIAAPPSTDQGDHPLEGIIKDGFVYAFLYRETPKALWPGDQDDLINRITELALAKQKEGKHDEVLKLCNFLASLPDPEAPATLGLSDPPNSHSPSGEKKRRGLKGITPFGKRMVRSAGVLLEEKAGHENLSFGTNTLPALEPEEFKTVCENWPELVRQFFQELIRELKRSGLPTDYVFVTEIQEKRYKRWGQICPHLHYVFQGRESRRHDWAISPSWLTGVWSRLLSNLLGREIDCRAATRLERPRGSLKKEMGKYLSKGGKLIGMIIQDGHADQLPSAWWGGSSALKREVKQRIVETRDRTVDIFVDGLPVLRGAGLLSFCRIEHELDSGRVICLGYSGFFKVDEFLSLIEFKSLEELCNYASSYQGRDGKTA